VFLIRFCDFASHSIGFETFIYQLNKIPIEMAEEDDGKEYRWETGYEKTW